MKFTFDFKCLATSYENSYGKVAEFVVNAEDLPADIPYHPNARMPSFTGQVAKSILSTLHKEPESFLAKNSGGIQLIAQSIKIDNLARTITVELKEPNPLLGFIGHGVVDGGHTYACINAAKDKNWDISKAVVKVSVLSGVKDSEIAAISRGRNLKKTVRALSIVNLAGGWDNLKCHLPDSVVANIAWRENEPGAIKSSFCSVAHLVKLLCCLDDERHPYLKNQHPRHAITSSSPGELQHVAERLGHLINEALWIEKQFYMHVNNFYYKRCGIHGIAGMGTSERRPGGRSEVRLADGSSFPFPANVKVVYPCVASFRVFLNESNQWELPLHRAWDHLGSEGVKITIKHLKKTFENRSSCDVVLRNSPVLYEELCLMAQRKKFEVLSKAI